MCVVIPVISYGSSHWVISVFQTQVWSSELELAYCLQFEYPELVSVKLSYPFENGGFAAIEATDTGVSSVEIAFCIYFRACCKVKIEFAALLQQFWGDNPSGKMKIEFAVHVYILRSILRINKIYFVYARPLPQSPNFAVRQSLLLKFSRSQENAVADSEKLEFEMMKTRSELKNTWSHH